jgi:hypothetical protein
MFWVLVCMRVWVFIALMCRFARVCFLIGFILFLSHINMTFRDLFCMRIWLFSCDLVTLGTCCFLVGFYFSLLLTWRFGDWFPWEFRYLVVVLRQLSQFHSVIPSYQNYISGSCSFSFLISIQFPVCMCIEIIIWQGLSYQCWIQIFLQ